MRGSGDGFVLRFDCLLENANDIEVFLVETDTLAFEILANDALLFLDGLGAAVNFLKEHLHEVGLANSEFSQFAGHLCWVLFRAYFEICAEALRRLLNAIKLVLASQ